MADFSRYLIPCLLTGKLAAIAILVSGGVVLQILACALYNNWWPMLTVLIAVDVAKFLTGASAVGSIAIPIILKHAGVIGWGAMAMELSSFFILVTAVLCSLGGAEDDGYNMF